jgi:hypothetical protein
MDALLQAKIKISNKQIQLGTFNSQVHAAKAFDIMALVARGPQAVANFPVSIYQDLMPLAAPLSRVSRARKQGLCDLIIGKPIVFFNLRNSFLVLYNLVRSSRCRWFAHRAQCSVRQCAAVCLTWDITRF